VEISTGVFFLFLGCLCLLSACGSNFSANAQGAGQGIKVVAAENFYGNLASQLGGSHVAVTSILSDPNVDPHAYQSNVNTGITVSRANLVIENGAGYDDWMDKILSSVPNSNRLLLKGYDLATTHLPENEHVWYSFANVAVIAQAITTDSSALTRRTLRPLTVIYRCSSSPCSLYSKRLLRSIRNITVRQSG